MQIGVGVIEILPEAIEKLREEVVEMILS